MKTVLVFGTFDRVPGTYEAVRQLAPDVICLGYDEEELRESLTAWLAASSLSIPVRKLPHFPVGPKP